MNEKMKTGNTMILDGVRQAMKNADSYEEKQMYQSIKSQIYLMEREEEIKEEVKANNADIAILKCNQIIDSVANGKDVSLFDISILLQIALKHVESKKDLCDSEIDDIRTIRQCIKGL